MWRQPALLRSLLGVSVLLFSILLTLGAVAIAPFHITRNAPAYFVLVAVGLTIMIIAALILLKLPFLFGLCAASLTDKAALRA
ncbi:hypothetical protein WJX81_003159 [Elliptochloris bilobata]|uniref:Uncharacterized protein n=1 Tax=Elliptochloris bilobata TaxID=381761 RepID=A0AAW1RMP3_9CHLO